MPRGARNADPVGSLNLNFEHRLCEHLGRVRQRLNVWYTRAGPGGRRPQLTTSLKHPRATRDKIDQGCVVMHCMRCIRGNTTKWCIIPGSYQMADTRDQQSSSMSVQQFGRCLGCHTSHQQLHNWTAGTHSAWSRCGVQQCSSSDADARGPNGFRFTTAVSFRCCCQCQANRRILLVQ